MTFRDPVLDLYHDGIEPAESAERGDHAELEARHDRLSDFYDPYPLAGWYALGAAPPARPGLLGARERPVPAASPLGGRNQPLAGAKP